MSSLRGKRTRRAASPPCFERRLRRRDGDRARAVNRGLRPFRKGVVFTPSLPPSCTAWFRPTRALFPSRTGREGDVEERAVERYKVLEHVQ